MFDIPISETDDLFAELLTLAAEKKTTDLHFASDGRLFFRAEGSLRKADSWRKMTDDEARVKEVISVESLRKLLTENKKGKGQGKPNVLAGRTHERTFIHRMSKVQVRVQYINTENGDHIAVRVQELSPPPLKDILKHSASAFQYLVEKPKGLVLITGPMGSGKTTLAASIAEQWAIANRHLVTLEDPVEYFLAPETGLVSHLACNFRDEEALADSVEDLLRSDMDALFVGEIRHALALRTCLEFAGMHEATITTLHGGSIPHSLVRLLTLSGENMSEAAVKRSLAQCIHAVVYVNLAFTKKGRPVPVVMCLPVNDIEIRKCIMEEKPEIFSQKIESYMKDHPNELGVINYQSALENAVQSGATRESAIAALPPLPVGVG